MQIESANKGGGDEEVFFKYYLKKKHSEMVLS